MQVIVIGDQVLLNIVKWVATTGGKRVAVTESIPATVVSVVTAPSHVGPDDEPALGLVYLDPKKKEFLGSPDWHKAFNCMHAVKHREHEDVDEGREMYYWTNPDYAGQVKRIGDWLLEHIEIVTESKEALFGTPVCDLMIKIVDKLMGAEGIELSPDPEPTQYPAASEGEPAGLQASTNGAGMDPNPIEAVSADSSQKGISSVHTAEPELVAATGTVLSEDEAKKVLEEMESAGE